jgi:hypothetical protein
MNLDVRILAHFSTTSDKEPLSRLIRVYSCNSWLGGVGGHVVDGAVFTSSC